MTRHTSTPSPKRPRQGPASPGDDEARWRAVLARDARCDGLFVFAVASTGIYCRPSCPARRPKRENVSFHATVAEAQARGFRACKRCTPDEGAPRHGLVERVANACRMIEQDSEPPSLTALAQAAGLSPFHFQRTFKRVTGLTPKAYAAEVRSQRMRDRLVHARSVTEAAHDSGFSGNSRFYAVQRSILGMPTRSYRGGGEGETIRHATAECSLGVVLVAATEHGICAILLGDAASALENDLARRFPKAKLVPTIGTLTTTLAAVVAHVETPASGLDLPLDLRGTAFQYRVWQALRQIPPGETRSYGAIAAELGAPGSARAVARACADNPLAVAVPCHRVVGADGAITGYRWGVERKRALLVREGAARPLKPAKR